MTEMPERIYVRNCNKVNGYLPVSDEPSSIFVEEKYIRADRYESLQAMAERLEFNLTEAMAYIGAWKHSTDKGREIREWPEKDVRGLICSRALEALQEFAKWKDGK